ncbi:MAG: efflux RND transporter periplasmic adaptor subunit [Flavobacteriales bacterium]|nr:efflux RND transporter periplasmic adaptor subunit [Flavobacteriales bacterium]
MFNRIVVTLFASGIFLFSCGEKEKGIHPERKALTEFVYGSGSIRAAEEYKVYSTVSGIVDEIFPEEGDTLQLDQLIARIKSDNTGLNEMNSKIAWDFARENYDPNSSAMQELKLAIVTAETRFKRDSVNFIRFKNLKENDAVSENDFEQAKLAFDLSANTLISARKRYETALRQSKTEMQRAENVYKMSANNKKDFELRSRMNGRVYAIYKQKGELVLPQEPIALIGESSNFLVQLLIDEMDIAKIRIGQEVLVSIDTYGDEVFHCRISKIYPMLDERSQTFKVEAQFEKAPEVLYPGLSLEGNILVNEKKDALVIPKSYLINKKFVRLESGEEKEIKTGLSNMEYVEVLEGLDEQSTILKPVVE